MINIFKYKPNLQILIVALITCFIISGVTAINTSASSIIDNAYGSWTYNNKRVKNVNFTIACSSPRVFNVKFYIDIVAVKDKVISNLVPINCNRRTIKTITVNGNSSTIVNYTGYVSFNPNTRYTTSDSRGIYAKVNNEVFKLRKK